MEKENIELNIKNILDDLINIYSEYDFYNEDDIIFVIKNIILKYSFYKEFCNEFYILDEFPIKLDYPRVITKNVFDLNKKDIEKFFTQIEEDKTHYKVEEDLEKDFSDFYKKNGLKGSDIGAVAVDMVIIEKENYNVIIRENKELDKDIKKHNVVIEIKFERNLSRRINNEEKIAKYKNTGILNYLRKDLHKNNNGNNSQYSLYKDKQKIDNIIDDDIAKLGYFIFISEGGKLSETFLQDKVWNFPLEKESESKLKNISGKGFMYIYKREKVTSEGKIQELLL